MNDEGTVDLTLQSADGPVSGRLALPLRVQVQGIEAVLVSADAYNALFQSASKGSGTTRRRTSRLTRLDKDAELQRFFLDRFGTDDVDRIRAAAIERFGAARVPSRAAINRFAIKVRTCQPPERA